METTQILSRRVCEKTLKETVFWTLDCNLRMSELTTTKLLRVLLQDGDALRLMEKSLQVPLTQYDGFDDKFLLFYLQNDFHQPYVARRAPNPSQKT